MINLKPIIYNALKTIATNVNDGYPEDWATFPVVQYSEDDNSTHTKTDNVEQLAGIRFKIDIWHNRSTSETADKVDEVLSSLGLKRTFCSDAPDPNKLKHKVMRFECIVDKDMKYIYD